jgi:hypothetical protein
LIKYVNQLEKSIGDPVSTIVYRIGEKISRNNDIDFEIENALEIFNEEVEAERLRKEKEAYELKHKPSILEKLLTE